MYKDTLTAQWQNLYSDFAQEYDRLKEHGKEPACFDRWYETRIHRWQSVAYPEGIILEQANRDDFSQKLIETLKAFRFSSVETKPMRPIWQGIALALAAGAASAAFLLLLRWEIVRVIISGIVVCVVAGLGFAKSEDTARKNESNRVKEAYVGQLKDYLDKLTEVCDQFETEDSDNGNDASEDDGSADDSPAEVEDK